MKEFELYPKSKSKFEIEIEKNKYFILGYTGLNVLFLIVHLFMHLSSLIAGLLNLILFMNVLHYLIVAGDIVYVFLQFIGSIVYSKKLKHQIGVYFIMTNIFTIIIFLIGSLLLSVYWYSNPGYIDIIGMDLVIITLVKDSCIFLIIVFVFY